MVFPPASSPLDVEERALVWSSPIIDPHLPKPGGRGEGGQVRLRNRVSWDAFLKQQKTQLRSINNKERML